MTDRKTPSDLKRAAEIARREATTQRGGEGEERERTPSKPQAAGSAHMGVKAMGTPGPELRDPSAAWVRPPLLKIMRPPVEPRATLARVAVGPAVRTQAILDAWLGDVNDVTVLTPEGPEAARWFGTDLLL